MSSPEKATIEILKTVLERDFIAKLPPPLKEDDTYAVNPAKHLSRAFCAFALHKICGISEEIAAQSVVDDYDDYGIDGIFYHALTETLYFVQSKFTGAGGISQGDSLKFCNGIRKLIREDFAGFNENVTKRRVEIIGALGDCVKIEIIVAHTGSEIDRHAKEDFSNFVSDPTHSEVRFNSEIINFNQEKISAYLQDAQAYGQVNTDLFMHECGWITAPRTTYFGLIKLTDLIELHGQHEDKLYQRNIRTFLGHKTDVNVSIRKTLAENPKEFVFLNNGVTALCSDIQPKNPVGRGKNLRITGISIINGAQTIGSSAKFVADNPDTDISEAMVSITLIKADPSSEFGDFVTRARNHQNQVLLSDFVALDEEQERLRRDIAYLDILYSYKATGANRQNDGAQIYVEEAAQGLAALQTDYQFIVLLKKKPIQLLNRDSEEYKKLFKPSVSAFQLVNAVFFNRYIQKKMSDAAKSAVDNFEESIYRNGNYIVAWILAKRIINDINAARLIDEEQLSAKLGVHFDELRQLLLDETQKVLGETSPANFFKNQERVKPLLRTMLSKFFGLNVDSDERLREIEQRIPDGFVEFLAKQAPQIKLND